MAKNKLLKDFGLSDSELDQEVKSTLGEVSENDLQQIYQNSVKDFEVDTIVSGRIVDVSNDEVMVDIGYKCEGIVPADQFDYDEQPREGEDIEVLLEGVDDDSGLIVLSRRKAKRIRAWENILETHQEGDVVSGKVVRKIKGGLLVDIGVPVFLPASLVELRRAGDILDFVGQEIECKIIKIDEARMNIVVSRRELLEERREQQKQKLLSEIEVNQIRKGVVKNITEFGAFVDLGGIDGLLHITDMSWGRVGHPSEVVQLEQEIEVVVLKVDKEKERISLGLKQKTESPWARIEEKHPVGSKCKGKVVTVLPYGAFVELEEGVEGLVHVSEMSWTRRITHPNAMVKVGDEVEVVVLDINKDKQEISLGMKQVEVNPWTLVEEKYPPGTVIEGKVRTITNYGAFVQIEEGIDGLLHVSDMSWTRKISHANEVLKKGDIVRAVVLEVDRERRRIALGMRQMVEDPWLHEIPSRYQVGHLVEGEVTKITSFGVFVQLEPDLEGLLHISELAEHKVGSPKEVVQVGDKVVVKIIRVDKENRKIGLSLKEVTEEDLTTREQELSRLRAESEAAEAAEAAQAAVDAEEAGPVTPPADKVPTSFEVALEDAQGGDGQTEEKPVEGTESKPQAETSEKETKEESSGEERQPEAEAEEAQQPGEKGGKEETAPSSEGPEAEEQKRPQEQVESAASEESSGSSVEPQEEDRSLSEEAAADSGPQEASAEAQPSVEGSEEAAPEAEEKRREPGESDSLEGDTDSGEPEGETPGESSEGSQGEDSEPKQE